jgi:DNA polymerase III subunit delta'
LKSLELSRAVSAFVEAAGKEAPPRRARLRQIMACAADYHRHLLHAQCGTAISDDRELQIHVQKAIQLGANPSERTAERLDRCLDAAAQVERNANQSNLIECWIDDLV